MQYLQELSQPQVFNEADFRQIYQNANQFGNPYREGLHIADQLILQSHKKITTMNEQIKAKREELKAISAGFKMLVKEGAIDSVNTGLAQYYAEQGHTTLKSYRQWRKDGFQVRKGTRALLMWGEPQPIRSKEKPATDAKEEDTFFPLAYVFSNLQVEPIR